MILQEYIKKWLELSSLLVLQRELDRFVVPTAVYVGIRDPR